jgi:hypothetical protein
MLHSSPRTGSTGEGSSATSSVAIPSRATPRTAPR